MFDGRWMSVEIGRREPGKSVFAAEPRSTLRMQEDCCLESRAACECFSGPFSSARAGRLIRLGALRGSAVNDPGMVPVKISAVRATSLR
jgi:hypothetical protein